MSKKTGDEDVGTVYEAEQKRKRRRLSSYFHRLAKRLRRGEAVPVDDEQHVTVDVPAESELDVELEQEDGETTLEIELQWPEEEGAIETDTVGSKARFELYEDNSDQHRWRLVHQNGNVIADSGQGYSSKERAKDGLESVRKNAPGAYVLDESNDEEVPAEGGSNATFELFEGKDGKYRWRLRHDNGNIIADGGQGYSSKQKAKQGLLSVQTNTPGAPIEE